MDERQRLDLWRDIDAYARNRTPASWADVERVVAGIEEEWANGLRRVLEAQPPLVPNGICDLDERCFEAGVIYTPYIPLQISHVDLQTGKVANETEPVMTFLRKVARYFAACEAKTPTPRSEDIVAANPMVPNANGDILPGIQFEVVTAAEVSRREMQPREVLTDSERFMRQVDAKILAEIEQTVAGLPKLEDLP